MCVCVSVSVCVCVCVCVCVRMSSAVCAHDVIRLQLGTCAWVCVPETVCACLAPDGVCARHVLIAAPEMAGSSISEATTA